MGKRNKQQSKAAAATTARAHPAVQEGALATRPCHPPAKQPTLLAVSVVLFALWFVFLLITAMVG